MSENPRRGRQVRNFTTNVLKILDLKSSSEQIFFRKLSLGAPVISVHGITKYCSTVFLTLKKGHKPEFVFFKKIFDA